MLNQQVLDNFNVERVSLVQNGLLVLMLWAIVNILVCVVAQYYYSGFKKQFLLMNVYWNLVNLALSLFGIFSQKEQVEDMLLVQTIEAQFSLEKVLLFNGGLDVGYVFLGLWLVQKSLEVSKNQERLRGYGYSIIVQGLWLFLFDLTFYAFLNSHGNLLLALIKEG